MGFKLDDHYEKDCFTVEELAKQWDCTSKDIDYLINETRELRLGMKVDDHVDTCLTQIIPEADIYELMKYTQHKFNDDRQEKDFGLLIIDCDIEGLEGFGEIVTIMSALLGTPKTVDEEPRYIYEDILNPIYIKGSIDKEGYTPSYISVQGFLGQRYILMDSRQGGSIIFGRLLKSDFRYITREERDRFVREHSGGISQKEVNGYRPNIANSGITSEYLGDLQSRVDHLAKKYPKWKESQRKVQNSGNLIEWIMSETKSKTREAEIIKVALIEKIPELKKR
jgi:hypothetical protein